MPAKSALSKKRGRVSFEFFKEQVDDVIMKYEPHCRTWRGLRVYATDGDQYELPRTEDILNQGYRGYPCADDKETHYPRMYVVHCYDVLGGVTKAFRYSNANEEMHNAMEIAVGLEEKSLTLYDRLFFCKDLVRSHQGSGSYFVARLKEDGWILPEIITFAKSSKRNFSFEFEGTLIHLIKVVNPRTGETALFATNLERSRFRNKEINDLYALRWEAETANRDMTHTLKMEQWHSHFLNGILQEIYTILWLMNQARVQMAQVLRKRCSLDQLLITPNPISN
ncbi:MAG: transposase [Bdellovibrionales bacterium]|nr:transposase [Bdellovibrionales bacterium]